MNTLSKDIIDKIGNSIIYLLDGKDDGLNKTQILKLLYILEEESVLKYNTPFFGISFEAWRYGPVNKDIFIEFSEEINILRDYISKETNDQGTTMLKPLRTQFDDSEFSNNDLAILKFVKTQFASKTATELVECTHKINSLWDVTCRKAGLDALFENNSTNNSNVEIDFSSLLDSVLSQNIYKDSLESKNVFESLKK
jgi:Uncharacterized phage-associated protein